MKTVISNLQEVLLAKASLPNSTARYAKPSFAYKMVWLLTEHLLK